MIYFADCYTGRKPLNPRIVLGALIIKHLGNFDDREVIDQISENVYIQYFLGYSVFSTAQSFDASLFVEIRKRLDIDVMNEINDKIIALKTRMESTVPSSSLPNNSSKCMKKATITRSRRIQISAG